MARFVRPGDIAYDFSGLDDGFGHWLAGFADGEGCFYIQPVGQAFICSFTIGLRPDDFAIIEEIRERVGLGEAVFRGAQARWEVTRKAEVVALLGLFKRYPLRAKKARDFEIWSEAVREWEKITVRRKSDWSAIAALKARLAERRTFTP